MKKIVLGLAAVAALGIAGCHKTDEAANNTADVNATANEANVDTNASINDAAAANLSGNTATETNAVTTNATGNAVDTGAATTNAAH
jgi:outer membrane murein-binding lipoprotein Lpp